VVAAATGQKSGDKLGLGGGSSFVTTGATKVSSATLRTPSTGRVTISYDPGPDSCPTQLVTAPEVHRVSPTPPPDLGQGRAAERSAILSDGAKY
jgi:hypothetical protein